MVMCMPLLSSITSILILGNISLPGTINFVAEFSSLLTATKYSIFVSVSVCIGIFLETVYSFFMYSKIYFGSFSNFTYQTRDLIALQYQSFTPLLALILLLGVMPNFIVPFLLNALAFQVSL